MSPKNMTRRRFLQQGATTAAVLAFTTPRASWASRLEPFTFGLCADVHQDVMHDAPERLGVFVRAMNERKATFIAQLGDFCIPKEGNRAFLEVVPLVRDGPHYHVLGNHDTDSENLTKNGYSQEETKAFWGMPANSYSFEHGGVRFIVLDGNDRPDDWGTDYPLHIGDAQLKWLETELSRTREPVIVLSHQGAEHPEGLDNGAMVRAISRGRQSTGGFPARACMLQRPSPLELFRKSRRHPVRAGELDVLLLGRRSVPKFRLPSPYPCVSAHARVHRTVSRSDLDYRHRRPGRRRDPYRRSNRVSGPAPLPSS